MVKLEDDITIEVAIMRKLSFMQDMLSAVDGNISVLRSRVNAVELGQIDLAKRVNEIGVIVQNTSKTVPTHQDYGN